MLQENQAAITILGPGQDESHHQDEENDSHADGREDVVEPRGEPCTEGNEGCGDEHNARGQEVRVMGQERDLPSASMGLREVLDPVVENGIQIATPGPGNSGPTNHVLQNDIPTYEEGPDLAHRDVGEHVCRARLGHLGTKLSIAEGSQQRGDASNDEGNHYGRPSSLFGHGASEHVEAGAHHPANAQQRQINRAQAAVEGGLHEVILQSLHAVELLAKAGQVSSTKPPGGHLGEVGPSLPSTTHRQRVLLAQTVESSLVPEEMKSLLEAKKKKLGQEVE
ncbi:hypothetical protein E2320_012736 [Naja naja]|nr:hypothetical protein E2320_012736 [Naja naja]